MASYHGAVLQPTLYLQIELAEPTSIPDKWDMLFRYDPAVLVVSIRYRKDKHFFGKLLRDHLHMAYSGNEQAVR